MLFKNIEICCPSCQGDLAPDDQKEILICQSCVKIFPIIFGIPDLRVFPDPYISIVDDRKKGLEIAERFNEFSFSGLVEYYYRMTTVVPAHHAEQYTRGLLGAVGRAKASLETWEHCIAKANENLPSSMLEIGCGTAPLLVAAVTRYQKVVGIDIAFRWLVMGKKRLTEVGLDLPLICACAEALPFPHQAFDRVIAESTIEMVNNQSQAVNESRRVLKSGGYFFLSTPNQFSLGPDPHVGILAGGFFPKTWLSAYVRQQGGIPPKRQLLSYFTLSKLLINGGFPKPFIFLSQIAPAQREQFGKWIKICIDIYNLALRAPIICHLLYCIGPLFHAVAQEPFPIPRSQTTS